MERLRAVCRLKDCLKGPVSRQILLPLGSWLRGRVDWRLLGGEEG